jgi:hypothetical protein
LSWSAAATTDVVGDIVARFTYAHRIAQNRRPLIAMEKSMVRKYSSMAQNEVEKAMHERKHGTLKSGKSGKKVKSRKQAIAIGLSKARKKGAHVPAKSK